MTNLTILFSGRLTRLEERNVYRNIVYIVLKFLSASSVCQRRDVLLFFPLFKHKFLASMVEISQKLMGKKHTHRNSHLYHEQPYWLTRSISPLPTHRTPIGMLYALIKQIQHPSTLLKYSVVVGLFDGNQTFSTPFSSSNIIQQGGQTRSIWQIQHDRTVLNGNVESVLSGPRGSYLTKFCTWRLSPPEVQTLTLKHTNFYQNGTPPVYLEQNCTPFLYLKDKPKQ